MDIDLEIHAPGLDMAQERWTRHLIFLGEVHKHAREIAGHGRERYQREGRGTLYISEEQWREVTRGAIGEASRPFPCSYVPIEKAADRFDFDVRTDGFVQVPWTLRSGGAVRADGAPRRWPPELLPRQPEGISQGVR